MTGSEAPPRPALIPIDSKFNQLPTTRQLAATVYIPHQDQAILIGGERGTSSSTDLIEIVDISTGESSSLGTLPTNLQGATAAYSPDNDTVYVFGGLNTDSSTYSDGIYAIDPNTGDVRTLSSTLPNPVSGATAVYHEGLGMIYVFGGRNNNGVMTDISAFDPLSETISYPLSFTLPSPRSSMAAVYSGAANKIYYFGGYDDSLAPTSTIFEISLQPDGHTGTVSPVTPGGLPRASYGLVAVEDPISRLIYLMGIEGLDRIAVFDPVTTQLWQTLIQLPETRVNSSVVYSPHNRQAVLMGGSSGAAKSDIWRIPLGDGPAIPLGRWDFPTPVGKKITAMSGSNDTVYVATDGEGVWRYEGAGNPGTRTATYPVIDPLGTGSVRDVHYDRKSGVVTIATADGAAEGTADSIAWIDPIFLGTNDIESVEGYTTASQKTYTFFGTNHQGLRWHPYSDQANWRTNFLGEKIETLTHRADGELWAISGYPPGLARLIYTENGPGSETKYGLEEKCHLSYPRDIAFSLEGDMWLVANIEHDVFLSSICRIPAAAIPGPGDYLVPGSLGNNISAVDVDADGRIWVSVNKDFYFYESGGLAVYETVGSPATLRVEEYNWLNAPVAGRNLDQGFPGGELAVAAYSDFWALTAADERVWGGKENGQLVTVSKRWQQLDESNNLDQEVIEGVWTVRGRAFFASNNTLHILEPDGANWDKRSNIQVLSVMGDRQGRIWVGTDTDVRLYTADGWDMLADIEGSPPVGPINALAMDQADRIWIGGNGGLTLFDAERFVLTLTASNSDLPNDSVRSLLVDRDNRLWVGTANGLAQLDGLVWTTFTTEDGLPDNEIYDLVELDDGQIAISTLSGISLFDEGSFVNPTLPIDSTNLPLTVDELGRLWAGNAVQTANDWQAYYWTNSGLRSSSISDNAADGADRIWFSHAPDTGVSVRGTLLPPLANTVPVISSISPDHGSAGDEITINGTGFGANPDHVEVIIGDAPVDIISVSETQVVAQLNDNNRSGNVSINVGQQRNTFRRNDRPAFCAEPVITSFDPTGGNNGVRVNIYGTNFDRRATVILGGGTQHTVYPLNATHLRTFIEAEDGTGPVQVINSCPDSPNNTFTTTEQFQRIDLSIENIVLNQGIKSTGLVNQRRTLIQYYLSHSLPPRSDQDQIEIDRVEVTFINPVNGSSNTHTVDYDESFNTTAGTPPLSALRDIANSLNIWITPGVQGLVNLTPVEVRTELFNNGRKVAENSSTVSFRPNFTMRVLLVPIMRNGYSEQQLRDMQARVNKDLGDLRRRIMPTGRVDVYWSPHIFTVDDVLIGDASRIDIGDWLEFYDASHSLDRARRWWNAHHDPDTLVVVGVVDPDVADGSGGVAGRADINSILNSLILDTLDTVCDVANVALQVVTIGFFGDDDGCQLELPLYAALVRGDGSPDFSETTGHEIGHTFNLVLPWMPNHDTFDNFGHSSTDELDNGECGDSGTSYNVEKTLYFQSLVTEPIVNPLTETQFKSNLNAGESADRAKAMMSYACTRESDNSFFEPVDIPTLFTQFAAASGLGFRHDLGGILPFSQDNGEFTNHDILSQSGPTPQLIPGLRLYVSGTINKTSNSGTLRTVEVLGEDAPLDASYNTGYWLVQLDNNGNELARAGIFPSFAVEGNPNNDTGFFATTLLLSDNVASLELRQNEAVLDTFTAGENAPDITISSPTESSLSPVIPVTWAANDPDGDIVNVVIQYSADGGTSWVTMAFGNASGTVEIPVTQLPGSNDARFRVIASDGFNRNSAISNAITVPNQAPRPFIDFPNQDSIYLEGQSIMLSGGADDNQDGFVANDNLFWRSNRDGDLGLGSELDVFLGVGTHIITLEAKNTIGLTATTSVTITVEGDYDRDGLSDEVELANGLNPLTEQDAYSDNDGDDLILVVELARGLDPNNPDSDGDGRNDGDEVAAGTDPLTGDLPRPSDSLQVFPSSLVFEADLSQDVPFPQQEVLVISQTPVTWTLTADVDWLAASTTLDTTPAGSTILVDAHLLSDGVHTGNLLFTSNELSDTVTVPVTVNVTNSSNHFDFNDDEWVNLIDVQQVAAHIPSNNSQETFDYHYDLDRDGDTDPDDAILIGHRWIVTPTITPDPIITPTIQVNAPVSATGIFTVDLFIDNAQNLAGFEFEFIFDPALLKVLDVESGDLLSSTGRVQTPLGPQIDNTTGKIAFGGYSYGPQAGANGYGLLGQITFHAIGTGSSNLDIQKPLLVDPQGNPMRVTSQSASINVNSGIGIGNIYLPIILK